MLRGRNKRLNLLVVGVLCILALISLYTLTPDDQREKALEILPGTISLQVKNVHFTEVGDSGIAWEISADTATLMKQGKSSLFDNVRVKLTATDGSVYTLTARKGSLRTDTKDISMEGDVVIISDQGTRFKTDRLDYSHAGKRVHTDSVVMIETPFVSARGSGMSLDLSERRLTLFSGVRAEIKAFSHGRGST